MPVSATTLKMMMEQGLSNEAILALVASIDADHAVVITPAAPARTPRQDRNARYYDSKKDRLKASEKRLNKTSYEMPPSPTPPTSNPTPLSPPKGDSSPLPEGQSGVATGKTVDDWVEEIWAATPQKGRQRSGKRDLQRAMAAAVGRRSQDPEAIAAALKAYYASPDATKDGGEFAKGVHRLVQEDRWAPWSAPPKPTNHTDPAAWPNERWMAAISRWRSTGHWPAGVGPPPDDPSTLAPAHLRPAPLLRAVGA